MEHDEIKSKRTRFISTEQLEKEQAPETTPPIQSRVFGTTALQIIHDLYKLLVAPMKKNTAQDGQMPSYINAEHCHFFHTITSDGKEQNTSSTIGGHFHVMEILTPATENTAAVYKSSPPMAYYAKKNKYGIAVKTLMLFNDDDMHTHDVQYIKSEKIQLRQKNFEAAAHHATTMARFDRTVPGVQ